MSRTTDEKRHVPRPGEVASAGAIGTGANLRPDELAVALVLLAGLDAGDPATRPAPDHDTDLEDPMPEPPQPGEQDRRGTGRVSGGRSLLERLWRPSAVPAAVRDPSSPTPGIVSREAGPADNVTLPTSTNGTAATTAAQESTSLPFGPRSPSSTGGGLPSSRRAEEPDRARLSAGVQLHVNQLYVQTPAQLAEWAAEGRHAAGSEL